MIHNIQILIQPDEDRQALQAQAARDQILIDAHRRGEHPWGRMVRACPLCQLGK